MKKVVICANINDEFISSVHKISKVAALKDAEVHLVHCMKNVPYLYDFAATYYPTESQMLGMKTSIEDILMNQKNILTKDNKIGSFKVKVLLSTSPEEKVVTYLDEIKADLVIAVTGERNGIATLFHSSFSNYLNSHAPCDVYIIRNT
jgi:nucleotide-binding universal stress UspA family protein